MTFFTDPLVLSFLGVMAAVALGALLLIRGALLLIRWTCLDLAAEDDRERQRLNPPGGITPPRHRR